MVQLNLCRLVVPLSAALCASTLGCGPLQSSGGSDEGSDAVATDGATSQAEGDGATGSEGGSGGADETDTGDGSGDGVVIPTALNVSGPVADFNPLLSEAVPIVGAEISLIDHPEITAVSDAEGLYALEEVPLNSRMSVEIQPSEDYLGSFMVLETGEEHIDDFELSQVSKEFISIQQIFLAEERADYDPDAAVIVVRLLQNTAAGPGATATLDPAPAANTYYAPDTSGIPILNSNTFENAIFPTVVFYNVEGRMAGDYTLTIAHPERECSLVLPEFPTRAGFVTLVDVDCPPPG